MQATETKRNASISAGISGTAKFQVLRSDFGGILTFAHRITIINSYCEHGGGMPIFGYSSEEFFTCVFVGVATIAMRVALPYMKASIKDGSRKPPRDDEPDECKSDASDIHSRSSHNKSDRREVD